MNILAEPRSLLWNRRTMKIWNVIGHSHSWVPIAKEATGSCKEKKWLQNKIEVLSYWPICCIDLPTGIRKLCWDLDFDATIGLTQGKWEGKLVLLPGCTTLLCCKGPVPVTYLPWSGISATAKACGEISLHCLLPLKDIAWESTSLKRVLPYLWNSCFWTGLSWTLYKGPSTAPLSLRGSHSMIPGPGWKSKWSRKWTR